MKNNLLIKAFFGLLACTASAFAEVNYVQAFDLAGTFSSTILSTSQSPIHDDGYRVPDAFSEFEHASLDFSTGSFGYPVTYPDINVTPSTMSAWVGQNSTGAYSILITNRQITVYSIDDNVSLGTARISAAYSEAHSIAARSMEAPVSLLADTTHYTIDPFSGQATVRPLFGVDMASAHFMAYGADGLLYVLDYGNRQIDSFDPANTENPFAAVRSFTLDPGTTVANTQFAIGVNGSFYLADGLGGGSYYNSLGQFQGTFGLPTDPVLGPYTGASFINTDAEGNIFVYDSAKGLHQYQDTSVVPEPGTVALLGLGALALLFRRRVIRPAIG